MGLREKLHNVSLGIGIVTRMRSCMHVYLQLGFGRRHLSASVQLPPACRPTQAASSPSCPCSFPRVIPPPFSSVYRSIKASLESGCFRVTDLEAISFRMPHTYPLILIDRNLTSYPCVYFSSSSVLEMDLAGSRRGIKLSAI